MNRTWFWQTLFPIVPHSYLFIYILLISETGIIIRFKIMHDLTALIHHIINNYKHNWERNRKGTFLLYI